MSIELISVKCPDCGASLDVEAGRKQLFCSYCGAKILLNNENEFVYRNIDEVELKKLELEEKRRLESKRDAEENKRFKNKLSLIGCVISVFLWIIAILLKGDPIAGLLAPLGGVIFVSSAITYLIRISKN